MIMKDVKINAYRVALHIVNSVIIRAVGIIVFAVVIDEPWVMLIIAADIGLLFDLRRYMRKEVKSEVGLDT